jgi:hypothetical protein
MAIGIVDRLESIHVCHDNRKGTLGAGGARHFLPQDGENSSMIPKTGKRITTGPVAKGLPRLNELFLKFHDALASP